MSAEIYNSLHSLESDLYYSTSMCNICPLEAILQSISTLKSAYQRIEENTDGWQFKVTLRVLDYEGKTCVTLFLRCNVSCEPLRIFWNDYTTCSTQVPRVLSTTGWKARNPARSRQLAWHSCRAGCIVFSENPQGLATHMVLISIAILIGSTECALHLELLMAIYPQNWNKNASKSRFTHVFLFLLFF